MMMKCLKKTKRTYFTRSRLLRDVLLFGKRVKCKFHVSYKFVIRQNPTKHFTTIKFFVALLVQDLAVSQTQKIVFFILEFRNFYAPFELQNIRSRVAQWKRAGPITQRSVDRNYALLSYFFLYIIIFEPFQKKANTTPQHT